MIQLNEMTPNSMMLSIQVEDDGLVAVGVHNLNRKDLGDDVVDELEMLMSGMVCQLQVDPTHFLNMALAMQVGVEQHEFERQMKAEQDAEDKYVLKKREKMN